MGIRILVRQFPPKEVLDPDTQEVTLVDSPIEMWHAQSESWWLGGFLSNKDKTKKEIIEKSIAFIKENDAMNQNVRISIEGFPGYQISGRYDSKKGIVCILSSDKIKDVDYIQKEVLIEEGPPPVIDTFDERILPLWNLIENILDPENPLPRIGANEKKYMSKRVWPKIEANQALLDETVDVARQAFQKAIARGAKIEEIEEKAQRLEVAAREFRAKAEELADPGCFGGLTRWITRKVGCNIL